METPLKEKLKAFSLVELMISLIVISLVAVAFTPVLTKKLSRNSIIAGGSASEITNQCSDKFSSYCKLCTKTYCVQCSKTCEANQYVKTRECKACNSCSDFDLNCKTCTQDGCTKCNSSDYYLKDGKCTPCPTDKVCDGAHVWDKTTDCASGFYCKNGISYPCAKKFGSACATCNEFTCTSCNNYYGLKNGKCELCLKNSRCFHCYQKGVGICDYGACNGYVSTSDGQCSIACSEAMEGCAFCGGMGECYNCHANYYKNSSNTCTKCTLENCMKCKNGYSATNQVCSWCKSGYFTANSGKCELCSTKFDSNCVSCDINSCTLCKKGYLLNSNGKCEEDTSNYFNCSDENFIKIGNRCYTRKNIGDDDQFLKIPSTVTVFDYGQNNKCYQEQKCCWKRNCTSGSNYNACTRTLCNYYAAEEICSKFDFGGDNWENLTYNDFAVLTKVSTNSKLEGGNICGDNMEISCGSARLYWLYSVSNTLGAIGTVDVMHEIAIWTDLYKTNGYSVRCARTIDE